MQMLEMFALICSLDELQKFFFVFKTFWFQEIHTEMPNSWPKKNTLFCWYIHANSILCHDLAESGTVYLIAKHAWLQLSKA